MNKLFIPALLLLTFGQWQAAQAQDIHFAHFYENAQLRNPGLTGIFTGDYKAVANYRTQWGNIAPAYQTMLASIENRSILNADNGDALSYGLTVTYDKAGSAAYSTLQVYPAINYNKSLNDKRSTFISMGFAGGYMQRTMDPGAMTFDNQYIPGMGYVPGAPTGEPGINQTVNLWDLAAGLSLNSSAGHDNRVAYYVGVGAYHLNRPKVAHTQYGQYARLNMKWSGNLGVQWRLNPNFFTTVHLNYTHQDPYREIIGGAMLGWRTYNMDNLRSNFALSVGAFYRWDDAVIPTLRMDYLNYSLLFSYEGNVSQLQPALNNNGAGYEISLVLRGRHKKRPEQLNCPRFDGMMPGYDAME